MRSVARVRLAASDPPGLLRPTIWVVALTGAIWAHRGLTQAPEEPHRVLVLGQARTDEPSCMAESWLIIHTHYFGAPHAGVYRDNPQALPSFRPDRAQARLLHR